METEHRETEHRETEHRETEHRETEHRTNANRVVPAQRGRVSMPGDRLVKTRVAAGRTGGAYSLFEVEVGPGGGEGPHVQHREDECLYVVEGRFAFAVEGAKTEAGPGEHLYVSRGALHAYENVGEGVGTLLAVHTPGGPQERFVAAAGGMATGSDLSPRGGRDRFGLLAAEHGIEICEATENTKKKHGEELLR